MEEIKYFLESSSINGLTHISVTRKYVRLFWILVVITGFIGAGLIIYQSFQSWNESPVKTTIETQPIREITFPKVTVCPPKDTFTDLNYDLKMIEKMIIHNDTRNELANYALELLYDQLYTNIMRNLSLLENREKYSNWYYGHEEIKVPYLSLYYGTEYWVKTSAPSGEISTQYYGDKFEANRVQTDFNYKIDVIPPNKVKNNKNATLHFNIEKILMKDLTTGVNMFQLSGAGDIDINKRYLFQNYTPPGKVGYGSSIRSDFISLLKHGKKQVIY